MKKQLIKLSRIVFIITLSACSVITPGNENQGTGSESINPGGNTTEPEDNTPGTDNSEATFTIDNTDYSFTHGLVTDNGAFDGAGIGTDTHYFMIFELADSEFVPAGYTYAANDSSVSMVLTLYSAGVSSFDNGRYDYIYYNDVYDYYSLVSESFFEEGTELVIGGYWMPDKSFGIESGTVDVTYNGNCNFTLDVDLTIVQYNNYEQFIDGTEQNISFSYTGDFVYESVD